MKISNVFIFSLLILLLVGSAHSQDLEGLALSTSSNVYNFADAALIEGGWSRLVRTDSSVSMDIDTVGLNPGEVYTVWWIIFNNPGACSPDPEGDQAMPVCGEDDIFNADGALELNTLARVSALWAVGNIADSNGAYVVSASLHEGEMPGSVIFGMGLENAKAAEVHLIVRAHGPIDAANLYQQLNTPEEPIDVQFAVFLPPAL